MKNKGLPQAVQSTHDILLWIIPQIDKFPRHRRFTLGEKIELTLLNVLELLLEATYQKRNDRVLKTANQKLALVRHLWRLSYELTAIANKSYQHGSKLLLELGAQIGGWQKYSHQDRVIT